MKEMIRKIRIFINSFRVVDFDVNSLYWELHDFDIIPKEVSKVNFNRYV